jgi:hypothetical protein
VNEDPLAPARGCLNGSCLGCLAWVAICVVLAVVVMLAGAWD